MMRHGNFGRPGPMGNFRGHQGGNFPGGRNQGNFNRNQGNYGRYQNQGGGYNNNPRHNQGNRFQGRQMQRNEPPSKPNTTPTKPSKPEENKAKQDQKGDTKTPVPTTPTTQEKKEQVTPKQTNASTTPVKKEETKPATNNTNSKNTMPSPQPPKQQQKQQGPQQKQQQQPPQQKQQQQPPQQKQQQQQPQQKQQVQQKQPQQQRPPTPQKPQQPPQKNQPQQKPQNMDVDKPQDQKPEKQQYGHNQKQDRPYYQRQKQGGNRQNRDRDSSFSRNDHSDQKEEKKFTGRCRLFVGNLTPDVTEDEFRKMFEQFGEVSEAYVNSGRGFGFIRMDYRHNAEAAKAGLDGLQKKGRQLRVRFATHGAALKVKNIHAFASNELLESAFSQFGDLERAVVIVDDRGKPTGDGIVEFVRKPGAQQALRRINDGIFLLGASPRPITVEPLEQKDEDDGMPEKFVNKNEGYKKEREKEPRFAIHGSFEHEFAQRWRQIDDMEKERIDRVKKEMDEARLRLEDEMQGALIEFQAEQIRKDLMRQQEELRRLEEMRQQDQMRRRQDMEIRQREEERMRVDEDRRIQEMMMNRHGGPMDQGGPRGRDEMMGGMRDGPRGMKDGAPPLPPPPAPPAGMGLDRSGRPNQMGGNFNAGMGGGNGGGNPGGNMGGGMPRQSRFDQQGGNFDGGFQAGGGMGGNMGPGNMSGGPGGPGNMFGGQGMGGANNMGGGGGPGMRGGGDRMDRRREGGPRDDYGEIKRRRY